MGINMQRVFQCKCLKALTEIFGVGQFLISDWHVGKRDPCEDAFLYTAKRVSSLFIFPLRLV